MKSCTGICVLLLTSLPASSQLISVGIKGGVPFTSVISQTYSAYYYNAYGAYDRPYTVGPTVEVHLPLHLSVEVDALYRRSGFNFYQGFNIPTTTARTLINDWQFPILAKYERGHGPGSAFVDGGLVTHFVSKADNVTSIGEAFGGGVSFKLLKLKLSPEIRYTHFNTPPYPASTNIVLSAVNQAELLVGLTF